MSRRNQIRIKPNRFWRLRYRICPDTVAITRSNQYKAELALETQQELRRAVKRSASNQHRAELALETCVVGTLRSIEHQGSLHLEPNWRWRFISVFHAFSVASTKLKTASCRTFFGKGLTNIHSRCMVRELHPIFRPNRRL